MRLEGQKADGTLHELAIWVAASVHSVEVNQGFIRKLVKPDYLALLADGCTLTVIIKVAFTGNDETQALVFPLKKMVIINNANAS